MARSTFQEDAPITNAPEAARALRQLLLVLIIELTLEGIARKLAIPGTSVPIFLLKDVIVLLLGIQVVTMRCPPAIDFLRAGYFAVIVLFLPVIVATALHDPFLAVFGAKQYLFYPIVGFAVYFAFCESPPAEIVRFYRGTSLLIIPTVVISFVQLRLPPSHWLNLSVDGELLSNFSAGGMLRVSSTFSFVAQYSAFLNAEIFMLIISLYRLRDINFFWKCVYLALIPLLVISCYITGSRSAVVGNTVNIIFATALCMVKMEARNALRVGMIVAGIIVTIVFAQHFLPQELAAYSERERGNLVGVSGEIRYRVFNALFGWMSGMFSQPFLGHGLGIMSNGSDTISAYAAKYRDIGLWTETDFATTLFEGGFYLVLVWYGFRFFVIYQTTKRFLLETTEELSLPAAFSQALVIVFGMTATLGMQPPMAIWWWLAVGTSLVLWWKCVEPTRGSDANLPAGANPERKIPGRSVYAERLHAGR